MSKSKLFVINMIQNMTLIMVLVVWSIIWKGLGLWYSARNEDKIWFILILVVNTVGIIPIIYLALKTDFFQSIFKSGKTKKKKVKKKKK